MGKMDWPDWFRGIMAGFIGGKSKSPKNISTNSIKTGSIMEKAAKLGAAQKMGALQKMYGAERGGMIARQTMSKRPSGIGKPC